MGKTRDHRRKINNKEKPVPVKHKLGVPIIGKKARKNRTKTRRRSSQSSRGIYLGEYRDEIVEKKEEFDEIQRKRQLKIAEGDDDSAERAELRNIQNAVADIRSNMDADLSNHPLFAIDMNEDQTVDVQLEHFKDYKADILRDDDLDSEKARRQQTEKQKAEIRKKKIQNKKRVVQSLPAAYEESGRVPTLTEFESDASISGKTVERHGLYYLDSSGELGVQKVVGRTNEDYYLLDIKSSTTPNDVRVTLGAVDTAEKPRTENRPPIYKPTASDISELETIMVGIVDANLSLKPGWNTQNAAAKRSLRSILTRMQASPASAKTFVFTVDTEEGDLIISDPDRTEAIVVPDVVKQ